ncbi:MAG: GNAT family N-acetyltransferase [Pseudonocardiaceae bacterium]
MVFSDSLADLTGHLYRDADLPQLMSTVAEWIAAAGRCGYDHIGELPHRIYENLRGTHPVGELVRVWKIGGELAGIGIYLRFGNAFDLFVVPPLRGTAVERHMLRAGYHATADHPDRDNHDGDWVLTDAFDCDTARIGLLAELGFERFRIWDHVNERGLADPIEIGRAPRGFRIRSARLADADQLAAARNSAFGESWTGDLYRRAVMEKPGYLAEREIVAEAPDGRIAAFAVFWVDDRNGLGHFEPFGTHGDFRRRGLARLIMLHAMQSMRERGLKTVTVNHDAENTAAARLYASLGFVKRHETYGYRRAVSA